jgi:hypothetical protein
MPSLKAMAWEAQNFPKGAASKQAVKRKPPAAVFKSTERVADSDLESETESESSTESDNEPIKVAPPVKKLNGHKALQESLSSDEESEEEEEEEGEEAEPEDEEEERQGNEKEPAGGTKVSSKNASASGRESENQNTPSESGSSSGSESDPEEESTVQKDSVTVGDRQRYVLWPSSHDAY